MLPCIYGTSSSRRRIVFLDEEGKKVVEGGSQAKTNFSRLAPPEEARRLGGRGDPRPCSPEAPGIAFPVCFRHEVGMPNSHLRILQVVNVRWFNATAWYGIFLASLLRRAGHDVRVLGLAGTDSFAKATAWGLNPLPLNLNSPNPLHQIALWKSIRKLLEEFRPHVVNCHRGEGFFLWGLARKTRSSAPFALVRTRGDQRPPGANRINRILHQDIADAVIATNAATAAALERRLGVPSSKLFLIPGGVDDDIFHPDPEGRAATRRAWGLEPEERALGLVGRFDAVKGQKELIEAFAMLQAHGNTNIRLVLAGFPTGISQEQIETWAREAGISKKVIITGRVADIRACIAAFDLGIVASLGSEAIARAALEIMACGVPLLSSRVGVMPDLLAEEALFPPGDPQALAKAIGRFLTDPSFGPALLQSQKQRMASLTGQAFLEQTLRAYRMAMANAGVPEP